MAIHSFLKAERGDPDWQFTPDQYFGKEFQMVDANSIELRPKTNDLMVLRQTPTDKKLLAKHLSIRIKEEAELDLFIINEADSKLQQIFLYDIYVHEGGKLNLGLFAKDGKLNKHILQIFLEDEASVATFGLLSNHVKGDTEVIIKIIHKNPGTVSNQLFLGLAGEQSQTVFQGMVGIEEGSEGSEANVSSINLITDSNARCFSKPEIYGNCANTVSHLNSSTETMSPEKIYYLQTRGLTQQKARTVITSSFKNQVFNLIPYNNLKEEIQQMYAD
jgi:Fe-S cluster assembly protein SufD